MKVQKDEVSFFFRSYTLIPEVTLNSHCLLFTPITIHGTVVDNFRVRVIIPVPKERDAKVSDIANYCRIASSSLLGKIFDNLIFDLYHNKSSSRELQFGA